MTELGRILDPVADRLAIAAGLLTFAISGIFPFWAALLILVRDVAVLLGGRRSSGDGEDPGRGRVDREARHVLADGGDHLDRLGERGRPLGDVLLVGGWLGYAVGIVEYYLAAGLYAIDVRDALADARGVTTRIVYGRAVADPSRRREEAKWSSRKTCGIREEHEWARSRTAASGWASPISRRMRWATWSTWTSPRPGRRSRPARRSARSSPRSPSRTSSPRLRNDRRAQRSAGGKPELVNEHPYGDGWLIAIEPSDPAELDGLLDAAAYRSTSRAPERAHPSTLDRCFSRGRG